MATSYFESDERTPLGDWLRGFGRRTTGLVLLALAGFLALALLRLPSGGSLAQPGDGRGGQQSGRCGRRHPRRSPLPDLRAGHLAGAAGRPLLGGADGRQPARGPALAAARGPAPRPARDRRLPRRAARSGGGRLAVSDGSRRHRRRFRVPLSGPASAGPSLWLADRWCRPAPRRRRPRPALARGCVGIRPGRSGLALARPPDRRCRPGRHGLFQPGARGEPAQPTPAPGRGGRHRRICLPGRAGAGHAGYDPARYGTGRAAAGRSRPHVRPHR